MKAMPLKGGQSQRTVSANIRMLQHEGKTEKQAIRLAVRKAYGPKPK